MGRACWGWDGGGDGGSSDTYGIWWDLEREWVGGRCWRKGRFQGVREAAEEEAGGLEKEEAGEL